MAQILVVDDEPLLRRLLSLQLSAAGHVALEASDGDEALSTLNDHKVDLVLLDHLMPRCDGYTVLEALRRNSRTAKLPVIMLSAFSSEKDRSKALKNGADDYVVKPFGATDLAQRIYDLLPVRGNFG
jgi:DNA-binding response OmpR family regulator